jgi:glycosyltransferase involved in cell wall biosynthesis
MRMITTILSERGEPFAVLSFLDNEASCSIEASVFCTPCNGSKWRFGVHALRLAFSGQAREIVVGHIGLLPVAWALRMLSLTDSYAITLHGIEAWCRLSWITRIAARRANYIVATTTYTAREFCFFNGVEMVRSIIIPLAAERRPPSAQRTVPLGGLKLLVVSRLSPEDRYKGFDTLLHAVRLALDSGLNLTLDIVGDGGDRARLENLARFLGIRKSVSFYGSLPDDQLGQIYRDSHVFVMPSKKEGFGIVFLEAMAAGLPCIGGNHGGTPEVIEQGVSGFLVEYGDANKLVFYFQALAESAELYDTMSGAARYRATETLGFDSMAQSWRELIDRLEASRNGKPDAVGSSRPFPAPGPS